MMVKHDDWWTKRADFEKWCKKYEIIPELDVAASHKNHLCEKYFTKEEDALTKSWYYQYHDYVGAADLWMNPPNSILKKFIRKAYSEWLRHGMKQLWIIPCQAFASGAFIDTVWKEYLSQRVIGERVIIDPIFPRPVFLEHGKEPENAAATSYMAVVLKNL